MNVFTLNTGYKIRKHPDAAIMNALLVGLVTFASVLCGHLIWQAAEGFQAYASFYGGPWETAFTQGVRQLDIGRAWNDKLVLATTSALLVGAVIGYETWAETPRTEPFDKPNPNDPQIHFDRDAEHELAKVFAKEGGPDQTTPLYIAPHIPIAGKADLRNFLVCGTAGSGKSNIIRPLTDQAIARGDVVVLHCSKGDVTRSFRTGDVVLVSPTHQYGWAWNMAEDITGPAAVQEFAAMVIPRSDQPFFSDTARLVFQDVMVSVIEDHPGTWDARVLLERVLADVGDISERIGKLDLSASPLITANDPDGESRTIESVMATMISGAMTTLKPMALAWTHVDKRRSFSVRKMFSATWTGPRVLIVQTNSDFKQLSRNLCGGLVKRICSYVTSPGANLGRPRVTMVLDEFNSLGPIEGFAQALSVAREHMLMVVVGVQALHQVHKLYGEEAREILDLLQIKIYGRLGGGQSAKEVAEALGEREINVTVRNLTPAHDDKRKWVSKNRQFPIVSRHQLEGELGNFNPGTSREKISGLISYAGNAYRLDWPPTQWKQQSKGYVPAKWTVTGKGKSN